MEHAQVLSERIGTSPAAEPRPESVIKEYEWALTDLAQVAAELEARLHPVLRPEMSEPGKAHAEPMAPLSDVRARLHDLHLLTARVRGLLDRLEV